MKEQKPTIVPEEIECSSGSVLSFNYKRVVYSLTMQPDKILIQQFISKSKTPAKGTSQIIMLNSLEEYQTWYSKLKLSYGKRITRRRLHYATTENGIIKYTDYPKATNAGMRKSEGIICIPETITTYRSTYTIKVENQTVTILDARGIKQQTSIKSFPSWIENLKEKEGRLTRRKLRYFNEDNGQLINR
nr:MAG: hypothetical protein [Bacteriophage sp.]